MKSCKKRCRFSYNQDIAKFTVWLAQSTKFQVLFNMNFYKNAVPRIMLTKYFMTLQWWYHREQVWLPHGYNIKEHGILLRFHIHKITRTVTSYTQTRFLLIYWSRFSIGCSANIDSNAEQQDPCSRVIDNDNNCRSQCPPLPPQKSQLLKQRANAVSSGSLFPTLPKFLAV